VDTIEKEDPEGLVELLKLSSELINDYCVVEDEVST